ncbi:M20/M25/M40 family metallo-hydrolase [uncultured Amnibacterium sp.]|uniref:M20/M25/M40 family metallo-hydrolase n=1 Tax=uncultured Amnibacterium sp. TaxID=1631851 RepID=UPI0035CB9B5F
MSVLEDEAVVLAQELIRIPTVNTGDPATIGDGETRAIRFVQERLEEVGLRPAFGEAVPGRGNLVVRIPGSDRSRGALVAHAHVDVVPVLEEGWTHPPFEGGIHDGAIWGRGALDMKGYAAVLVAVARELAREGVVPRRDLILAFFSDEEAGGVHGAGWVRRHRPEWLAGATEAIGEVGGFSATIGDRRAYLVATGEKGSGAIRFTARGRAGHASDPSPDAAVPRLARAIAAVAGHRFPVVPTATTRVFAEHVSRLLGRTITAEDLPSVRAELGGAATVAELGLRHSAAATVVRAGLKANVIPGEATAEVDVRSLPGLDDEARDAVLALAGDGVEGEARGWIRSIESPVDSPLLDVLQAAIAAEDPDGVVVPYLLPARPTTRPSPGSGSRATASSHSAPLRTSTPTACSTRLTSAFRSSRSDSAPA